MRDVPIPPELVSLLRAHRLASHFSQDDEFVFCSSAGTPLDQQNVGDRGFKAAAEHAGLNMPVSRHSPGMTSGMPSPPSLRITGSPQLTWQR